MKNIESLLTPFTLSEDETDAFNNAFSMHFLTQIERMNDLNPNQEGLPASHIALEIIMNNLSRILTSHHIQCRLGKKFIRSCIITHEELYTIASEFHALWIEGLPEGEIMDQDIKTIFDEIPAEQQAHFFNWVYAIPPVLKSIGYELYRPEEDEFINEALAESLAKTIHAKFRKHVLEKNPTDAYAGMYLDQNNAGVFSQEYDSLSDDIKAANIDNAFHIPTKLLAIGYRIEPVEEGIIPALLKLSDNEIEAMAIIEHDRWSWERRLNGWIYSPVRDNEKKHHNCLIPFDKLPPHEQEKDRIVVRFIPALLVDIGYRAVRISPELSDKIPYINQRSGFIFEVETQIRNLQNLITRQNDEIQSRFENAFSNIEEIDDLKNEIRSFHKYLSKEYLRSSLERLKSTNYLLNHIKGAYNNGSIVQRTFMPNNFDIKEYFPDSFILLKPKDIVSGDFIFVSKTGNNVLFAAADCTGHGISGSILSGICYNYLHEAIHAKGISAPSDVLRIVMPQVRDLLKHNSGLHKGRAEMELGLCSIDLESKELKVAAYGRPVYAFINSEMVQLGKRAKEIETRVIDDIHIQEVTLNEGDTVYTFSDGYIDQLGGPEGKKFKPKKLKELLSSIQDKNMSEQCEILNTEIENWIHCDEFENPEDSDFFIEQTDDISMIGVKV